MCNALTEDIDFEQMLLSYIRRGECGRHLIGGWWLVALGGFTINQRLAAQKVMPGSQLQANNQLFWEVFWNLKGFHLQTVLGLTFYVESLVPIYFGF